MDERPDQIEEHIHRTRGDLRENLNELQDRVRSAFDWRTQFEQRPLTMMGLALGGGVLAAAMLPRGGRRRKRYSDYGSRASSRASDRSESERYFRGSSREEREERTAKERRDSFEAIKGALLTGVATKVGSMLGDLFNHYKEQLKNTSRYDSSEQDPRYSERPMSSFKPH
jgi:hypothetical protein